MQAGSFLLYIEFDGQGQALRDDLETVSRVVADLNCSCSISGSALRISAPSASELLSIYEAANVFGSVGRVVLGECSLATVSAQFSCFQNVAKEVKFDFPVVVGTSLVRFIAEGLGMEVLDLGLQRFDELLPAQEVFCLLPPDAVGPRFEKLGLSLIDQNLPNVWDSFVGREREISDCLKVLERSQVLTIKGCGGIGKTRFGIHLAAATRGIGIEVIRFVPLSHLPTGTEIEPAFLAACSAEGVGLGGFVNAYRNKRTLIVLDNCEHVLESVRDLVRALSEDFPLLTVLCTSREPLGLAGEAVYELAPLDVPPESEEEWGQMASTSFGACRLFEDRYREHSAADPAGASAKYTIFRICRMLEGLPLAVEHAAFRASYMTLDESLESLKNALPRLKADRPGYEPRHQTIEATLQWSYDLLTQAERSDLMAASIFRSPFDHYDFASLWSAAPEPDRLSALFRKSMVRKNGVLKGKQVFSMLEAVSLFVRDLPDYGNRTDDFVKAWLGRACLMAEGAFNSSEGKPSTFDYTDISFRYPSISFALDHLFEKDPVVAVEMTRNLIRYWSLNGPFSDALKNVRCALAANSSAPWEIAVAEGVFLWLLGDLRGAEAVFGAAALQGIERGEPMQTASANANLAALWLSMGRKLGVEELLLDTSAKFQDGGNVTRAAVTLCNLARFQIDENRLEQALKTLNKTAELGFDTFPNIAALAGTLRFDVFDGLEMHEERLNALTNGLKACRDHPQSEQVPALLLRTAVMIAHEDAEEAAEVFGSATEAYKSIRASSTSREALKVRYEQLIANALSPNERIRLEAQGENIDPNYRVHHALRVLGLLE